LDESNSWARHRQLIAHFTSPLGSSEHSITDQSASSLWNFAAVNACKLFFVGAHKVSKGGGRTQQRPTEPGGLNIHRALDVAKGMAW
jgi:hypothetical protein